MSTIEKIEEVASKRQELRTVQVTEEDLILFFGEDYRQHEFMLNARTSYYVFEEENKLYYITVCHHEQSYSSITLNASKKLFYNIVDRFFLEFLVQKKSSLERYIRTMDDGHLFQNDLEKINQVLNHPSVRSKGLYSLTKRR